MSSALTIFSELRQIFPEQPLPVLKKIASYFKNDRASLEVFVRDCIDTRQFPPLPDQVDEQLEDFLRRQWQTLKEVLPDAEETFIQGIFDMHAGTPGMEVAVTEAIVTQNYPKIEVFDVKIYCDLVPDPMGSYTHKNYNMTDVMMTQAVDYLVKIFGEGKRDEISSVVKLQRSLYLSYSQLRERYIGTQLGLLVKTGQPKSFDTPDNDQVFEKLFIENEKVVMSFLDRTMKDERNDFETNEKNHTLCECVICCGLSTKAKIITICSAGHKMCNTCVRKYSEQLFNEGIFFFPCAFAKCQLLLANEAIRGVWDTSLYSKLLNLRILESKKGNELSVACPFCNFLNKDQNNAEILCSHCKKEFCINCKNISHFPLICNKRENDMCKLVEESMTQALIRKCPGCHQPFIKERMDCNKIICPKCHTHMCYVCRKVVDRVGYNHFYGQGRMPSEAPGCCPLHSDINVLHVNSVIETGKKAFQKMKSENPLIQLPYDPLAVLPNREASDALPNQF